jgi:4-alpha-glucanotransferase
MTPDIIHRTPLRACIIEAARAGNPPRVIAEDLGKPAHKVRKILAQERAAGVALPMFKSTGRPRKQTPRPLFKKAS